MHDAPQPFRNRAEAGGLLGQRLSHHYGGRSDLIVLGLPRGGVPVAAEVARTLLAPLDIYLVRKLGMPRQPELAMGAIASSGMRYLNAKVIAQRHVSPAEIEAATAQEWQELQRREQRYRQGRPALDLAGRVVIVVDDGIATGSTMQVAIKSLRQQHPQKLIVAVPVAPASSHRCLNQWADKIVCLTSPKRFDAVGEWYLDFDQVTDEQVCRLLVPGTGS